MELTVNWKTKFITI